MDNVLDISGAKDCKSLKERLLFFSQNFPNGGIQTFINSEPTSKEFLVRAIIHPDVLNATRAFTGYANGLDISEAENLAILRAFTFMGVGDFDTIGEFKCSKAE